MSGIRNHEHVIIKARVNNPPTDKNILEKWIVDVIESVDMKVVLGPETYYSEMEGNKGYTSLAVLDFSHIALHCWEEETPALIEFDLFSCKRFDINIVLTKLKQFNIHSFSLHYVNRDSLEFGKLKKLYVFYKTTNLINGKYYYGVHGFTDITDGYLGSGKLLNRAIVKHGKENFNIEYVKFFYDEESAYNYEKEIVNEDCVLDENCYNMVKGGKRGRQDNRKTGKYFWITNGINNKLVESLDDCDDSWYTGRTVSEKTKKKQSLIKKGKPSHRRGKTLPEAQKRKIKQTLINRYKSEEHHSKGKKYYIDGSGNRIYLTTKESHPCQTQPESDC